MRERLIWISAAMTGLLLAASLAVATSRVTQPPVGLQGEPISAGQALAPHKAPKAPVVRKHARRHAKHAVTAAAQPAPVQLPQPPAPVYRPPAAVIRPAARPPAPKPATTIKRRSGHSGSDDNASPSQTGGDDSSDD